MNFNRLRLVLAVLVLPVLFGFVLERMGGARLPVTPASPSAKFVWDGSVPHITERDKYRGGAYAYAADGDLMKTIILFAMNRWNSVPGSFVRLELVEGAGVIDNNDDINAMIVHDFGDKSSAAQAAPNIRSLDGGHHWTITDCDIMISPGASTATVLERTIAHELGHCLGLGHAHTNTQALMGYTRSDTSSALGADDMAGVVYLYPDPAFPQKGAREMISLESCGTLGTHGIGDYVVRGFALVCFLSPLVLIGWRHVRHGKGGGSSKSV